MIAFGAVMGSVVSGRTAIIGRAVTFISFSGS